MSWKKPFDYKEFLQDLVPYATYNKRWSKYVLQYYEDPEDDWFHYVVTKVKKTGEIHHVSMIIQKDVDNWVRYMAKDGWS
jgi:hypothetical protein